MCKLVIAAGLVYLAGMLLSVPAFAQDRSIRGVVRDAVTHDPLPEVNITIENATTGTATSSDGTFELKNLKPANYTLVFSHVGYKYQTRRVNLVKDETAYLKIVLSPSSIELEGIRVIALRPGMRGTARMERAQVRETNPTDIGGLLRNFSGINAVRRGPLGLDPVVRGLRGTEIGIYSDGTRSFVSCPARMDTPLSHLDPSNIADIKVVKGPYALTWGSGNMSAIWVDTKSLKNLANNATHIDLTSGYQSNSNELSEIAAITGKQAGVGFQIHGALRQGQDYSAGGAGETVPAHFLSREIRGKMNLPVPVDGSLTASAGFQNQKNVDYPGRMMNADHFNQWNAGLKYNYEPHGQTVQQVTAQVYANHISHVMNNNGKPTAQPDPDRMMPFAINAVVPTQSTVIGGRAKITLSVKNSLSIALGGDSYTTYKKARRSVTRKDNGMLMFYDLIWPNAVLTDGGLFVRLRQTFADRLQATGTIRYDYVYANADTSTEFFRENVSDKLKSTNGMLSGAITVNYTLNSAWSAGVGYGSVARTPGITERYSDRIPSSKAQTSAEFVGNPSLKPERNNQADLYLQADYGRVSWSFDGFVRSMSNFITIDPTHLPKRLPMSPSTVYRYVNGHAFFRGFESSLTVQPLGPLQLRGKVGYLWGVNRSLDEPALGVSPLQFDTGVKYTFRGLPLYLDALVHFVGRQDRVAGMLGEVPTGGYTTADIRAGFKVWQRVMVETGVTNLTNTFYVNHLNSKNPYTGEQIPEPGRAFYINVSLSL